MLNYYTVTALKHDGREKKGFILDRPSSGPAHVFIHFRNSINFLENGNIIKASPGACVIFTPFSRQWFEFYECDSTHDWLCFFPDSTELFQKLGLPCNRIFYPAQTHFITLAVQACEKEFINKELDWADVISSTLNTFFIRLKREYLCKNTQNLSPYLVDIKEHFENLRFDLYNHPEKKWSIDLLAEKLALSRSRFAVLYKNFFGISPIDDLIHARIIRAKYLLSNNEFKVSHVAEKCGYVCTCHFVRQFKKETGVTPGEFRNAKEMY